MERKQLLLLRDKLLQSRREGEPHVPNFLKKTYEILEKEEYKDIISWNDNGSAIVIKNPILFAETVLPLYFKHNNLASYIRQLNLYDFKKRKTHLYENTFVHEKFKRGAKELLCQIKRKGTEIVSMPLKPKPLLEDSIPDRLDLVQENQTLKQVQRTMSEKIQSLEKKLSDTTRLNELLLMQIQMLTNSENERFSSNPLENILADFTRKIFQSTNISAPSSFLPTEDLLSKLFQNGSPPKTLNWPSVQSMCNNLSPKEFKLENTQVSLNSDKGKVDYFENLLEFVSKINKNDPKK